LAKEKKRKRKKRNTILYSGGKESPGRAINSTTGGKKGENRWRASSSSINVCLPIEKEKHRFVLVYLGQKEKFGETVVIQRFLTKERGPPAEKGEKSIDAMRVLEEGGEGGRLHRSPSE